MFHQGVFDLALLRFIGQAQKVKTVRVFQRLAGQVGLRLGQTDVEVDDCLAAALQQAGSDVDGQHIARPAVLNGTLRIGQSLLRVFQPGQQHQVMSPR